MNDINIYAYPALHYIINVIIKEYHLIYKYLKNKMYLQYLQTYPFQGRAI